MGKISDEEIQQFLEQNDVSHIKFVEIRQALHFLETQKGYLALQIIGAGYFGIVVQVKNSNDDEYAIKIIVTKREQQMNDAAEEAQIIKALKSEYVVQYIDHFQSQELKTFFLVTEYCSQGNMYSLYKNSSLTKDQIIQYSLEVLYGIRDIQNQNIIHCDLKPGNFLISNDGRLKISDFGLAKFAVNKQAEFQSLGNVLYMPTEGFTRDRKEGKLRISYEYDVYSTGGILLYLCSPNLESQLNMIKGGSFPNIKRNPFAQLIQIAFSMMSVLPEDRKTINQIINILEPMRSGNSQESQLKQKNLMKQLQMDINKIEDSIKAKIDECFP